MIDENSDPDLERNPVELLAAEFLERYRTGERPTIQQYAERYPELAEEIRDLFPTIAAMENLKLRREERLDGRASLGAAKLERLGDFHILGEIGRGGMGIVYEAEQKSLGRHVAVKVLPRQSLLDEKRLARFRREARTAAKLHHTNIVPILGIGESDGYHYYVMQFIRGVGLDEIIEQLAANGHSAAAAAPSSGSVVNARTGDVTGVVKALLAGRFRHPRTAGSSTISFTLNRGPQRTGSGPKQEEGSSSDPDPTEQSETNGRLDAAADSPAAPAESSSSDDELPIAGSTFDGSANMQLGKRYFQSVARIGVQVADALRYAHNQGTLHRDIKPANLLLDSHGVVWVADFGLAKAMEQDNVSRTGDVVGTLRYMAPEQLQGHADVRSDVYSLGITLYELLTLQPAVSDAQCKLALAGRTHEFDPVHPRRINPKIPNDLETIVLKSIAPEPERRYQNAAQLEEDLQRFLDDRPILARRTTVVERLFRWCRRNRAVALLAALLSVLVISLIVMLIVDTWQTRKTKDQIEQLLTSETRQRERAELAIEAFLQVLEDIAERYAPERVARSSRYKVEDDGKELEWEIRPPTTRESAALLEKLLPFYDNFVTQFGNNPRFSARVAQVNRRLGDIQKRLGQYNNAHSRYQLAIKKYEQLQQASRDPLQYLCELARCYNELGNTRLALFQIESGRRSHETARDLLENAPGTLAQDPQRRYELARTYYFLARRPQILPSPGQPPPGPPGPPGSPPNRPRPVSFAEVAEPAPPDFQRFHAQRRRFLDEAVALLNGLAKQFPRDPDYPHLLALCYREGSTGPFSDDMRHAIDTLEQLTARFPDDPDYLYDLVETYALIHVRDPQAQPAQLDSAELQLKTALQYCEHLIEHEPDVPDYQFAKLRLLFNLGGVLKVGLRTDEALGCYDKALELQDQLVNRFEQVAAYEPWKLSIHLAKVRLFLDLQDTDEAWPLLDASSQALLELLGDEPELPFGRRLLVDSYRLLEQTLRKLGDERALQALYDSEKYQRVMDEYYHGRPRSEPDALDSFDESLPPDLRLDADF